MYNNVPEQRKRMEKIMPEKYVIASEFVDLELEGSLLSAIISRPEIYWEVADYLPNGVLVGKQELFDEIIHNIEQGKPIGQLRENDNIKPTSDPVKAAKDLADLYQKRLLGQVYQENLNALREREKIATDLIANAEDDLSKVQQAIKEMRSGRVVPTTDLFPEVLQDMENRKRMVRELGASAVGLPTGIKKLDELLGGLQTGIHLLAAEPGQGKTTLTLQAASHISSKGFPVLFVSFEESLSRLTLKLICQKAGLEMKAFSDGYGDIDILEKAIYNYGYEFSSLFLVEGSSRLTVPQIKARALQTMARRNKNKCLIIVDYLQRWAACSNSKWDFRHVVSGLVSELRELAFRLDSPVLIISSQNRPGQGKANLTSLKESGDLEYSADTALFLTSDRDNEAIPPARAVKLSVEKNRYGDKGVVNLIFRPDRGVFREREFGGCY